MWYPQQAIVQFAARFLKKRLDLDNYEIKKKVRRVLDLGCGNGSGVFFFVREGYETYGIDISSSAIKLGKNFLKRENLKADLKMGDANSLPYKDNFFDVVVSYGVLDHMERKKADQVMSEINRVLKTGGLCFLSLISKKHHTYGAGLKFEGDSYILQEGYETGLIQHFFDIADIKKLVAGWQLVELRHNYEDFINIKNGKVIQTKARYFAVLEKL